MNAALQSLKSSHRSIRILILGLLIGISGWFYMDYGRKAVTLYSDDIGYYIYLPATFIYHNLDSVNQVPDDSTLPYNVRWCLSTMGGGAITPTGHMLIQYTYGIAATELPFFLLAHLYEKTIGGNPNGYAPSYLLAIKLSSFVYAVLGMLILYRILRRHFSSNWSVAGIAGIYLGSNLFWFTLHQAGMAHVPLFFLYALLMWLTIQLYEKPTLRRFLLIGFVAGFIMLIRPTDIICLVIPLLYGITNRLQVRQRLLFLRTHWLKIAAMIPVFILPLVPQLLYWKALSGQYFYYSYGSNQQFFWKNPKIIEGLFYFQNGWLAYSPLMIFSLLGILCYRAYRPWNWAIWLLLPLYIYIIYSWYCFNYINGLGSRPMIHVYPLLALPFTACVRWIFTQRSLVLKSAFSVLALFFISLNISWSMQQSLGLLWSEGSNLAYNYSILYKTRISYNDLVVRDCRILQPDSAKLQKKATLGVLTFDTAGQNHIPDTVTGKGFLLYFPVGQEYWDERIRIAYSRQTFGDARWLRASGRFMTFHWPGYNKPELDVQFKHGNEGYREKVCCLSNKMDIPLPGRDTGVNRLKMDRYIDHRWSTVSFFVNIPKDRIREGDSIILSIHNCSKEELLADNLMLELFQE